MNLNFNPQHFIQSLIFIGFVLFILYRRFRRNFGKQKLRRGYMIFRMTLLCVVGALLLIPTFLSQEMAVVTIIGAATGVGLAIWAAKHTRFLNEDSALYYMPHSYTGIIVTALFVGRIAYRIFVLSQPHSVLITDYDPGMGDFGSLGGLYHNPWTRLAFFILIGYYVYYYAFVLRESKNLKPGDMEMPPADKPGGNI